MLFRSFDSVKIQKWFVVVICIPGKVVETGSAVVIHERQNRMETNWPVTIIIFYFRVADLEAEGLSSRCITAFESVVLILFGLKHGIESPVDPHTTYNRCGVKEIKDQTPEFVWKLQSGDIDIV